MAQHWETIAEVKWAAEKAVLPQMPLERRADTPENNAKRAQFTINALKKDNGLKKEALESKQIMINSLKRELAKKQQMIDWSSRLSHLLVGVSLAVWALLSGTGTLLAWQFSPESSLQAFASSVVKKFSNRDTGYHLILEWKVSKFALETEKKNNEIFKKIYATQDEIVALQKQVIERYAFRVASLEQGWAVATSIPKLELAKCEIPVSDPQILANFWQKTVVAPIIPIAPPPAIITSTEQPAIAKKQAKEDLAVRKVPPTILPNQIQWVKKSASAYSGKTYKTLSKLRQEIMSELPEKNLKIKIQEQKGGRLLVWLEFKGKKSIGYYAGTPKHRARLTKEGMKQWIDDSVEQIWLVDQIESVAQTREISSFHNGSVSMKIRKINTGAVELTFFDSFSKKWERFRLAKWTYQDRDIGAKIDDALMNLLY